MAERKIEDVVLYHGSLDELNSRNPHEQYRFAEEKFFLTSTIGLDASVRNVIDKGYDGLVNFNVESYIESAFLGSDIRLEVRTSLQGTPILRVK